MRSIVRVIAALTCAATAFSLATPAVAQGGGAAAAPGSITGSVVDQQTGLPLANVDVALYQGGQRIAQTRTTSSGSFQFAQESPGLYTVEVSAQGYQGARLADEAVVSGETVNVAIVVQHAVTSQSRGVIGRVSTTENRNTLATTTVINRNISADLMQNTGNLRVGDALLAQPGLTSFNLDSAPGDDLNISIRGLRPSEVQTMVNDVPVGPLGVFNGTGGGFNYQLSPTFGLGNVQITYGTGGAALLGVDALAGTIDFQTINPTTRPEGYLEQAYGSDEIQRTVAQATGTVGKLGFALSYGVQGSVGGFDPQVIEQSGLLGGNDTSANIAANTWLVSGNYVLRNDVATLRYNFTPRTALQLSTYIATSWDDKTGEGDNDFQTPAYVIYSAQQAGLGCTLPGGGAGLQMTTDAGTNCVSQSQYAAANSGPAGGTPLAFQTLSLQNYDARLTTSTGMHNVLFEGFANQYNQVYDRDLAGFTNQYWTFGYRVSDDIVTKNNDIGIGYFGEHQLYTAGNFGSSGVTYHPGIFSSLGNIFIRDIYNVTNRLTAFVNGNVKSESVGASSSFDPRLSLVYRPDGSNVFRVSAGRSTEAPTAQLQSLPLNISTQPGALNPGCGLQSIGTNANPDLKSETGKEMEVSYGHRFAQDSQIQVVGYTEDLNNVIFSSVVPLSTFGPGAIPANIGDYISRLQGFGCANASVANLGLTVAENAGAGRFQGIEVTGRVRFSPRFYADLGYDVMSTRYFNIPLTSQQNNLSLIDGGPIVGVPFQKASLGLDYTFGNRAELHLDGYFVGNNNALHRPPFAYANGFLNVPLQHNLVLNVGVTNIFNSAYQQYGLIGNAVFIPENQFGSDANAVQQAYNGVYGEEFGMPQRTVTFSLSTRIR